MTAFRKLSNGKWFVRVRRTGYPEKSQAFSTRPEAELWATEIESSMLRGSFICTKESERTTLAEAWDRYLKLDHQVFNIGSYCFPPVIR
jgi:hypothetical protein